VAARRRDVANAVWVASPIDEDVARIPLRGRGAARRIR
jgi:hypothetical protein